MLKYADNRKFYRLSCAAGCFREVIKNGAGMLGRELDHFFEQTILAMRSFEKPQE